jgi:broad specificity phosphatase PhoE
LTSHETKARETADIIGAALSLRPEVVAQTHENDRSATGYLPREDFEATADQFFANPTLSIRGWETANDAQSRIVSNIFQAIMTKGISGDVLCVGHGAVGTLFLCHLMDLGLSREHDQPDGGGNLFAFDMESDEVIHGWMPIEAFSGLTGVAF